MAGAQREPGARNYDLPARRLVLAAIAAHQAHNRGGATGFVHTPAGQLYTFDRGGRTPNERAFTRAAYHLVSQIPRRGGGTPQWSLKLSWGPVENHYGRWGRPVTARVFRRSAGLGYSKRHPGASYAQRPELRARPGARIDA